MISKSTGRVKNNEKPINENVSHLNFQVIINAKKLYKYAAELKAYACFAPHGKINMCHFILGKLPPVKTALRTNTLLVNLPCKITPRGKSSPRGIALIRNLPLPFYIKDFIRFTIYFSLRK